MHKNIAGGGNRFLLLSFINHERISVLPVILRGKVKYIWMYSVKFLWKCEGHLEEEEKKKKSQKEDIDYIAQILWKIVVDHKY